MNKKSSMLLKEKLNQDIENFNTRVDHFVIAAANNGVKLSPAMKPYIKQTKDRLEILFCRIHNNLCEA